MSARDDLVVIAQIAGAHGVRGDVRIRSFTEFPEDCFAYGPLLDEAGNVMVTPKKVTPSKDTVFIVWPEEDKQREEWLDLKGTLLYAPREALPEPEDDEFYFEDLIGCQVIHKDGRALGRVVAVHNFGADDLLEITSQISGDYMLPFTREAFPEIDIAQKQLSAAPDESLLPDDLRLDDEGDSSDADNA